MPRPKGDFTGQIRGNLTFLHQENEGWLCKCKCGKDVHIPYRKISWSRSCGCLRGTSLIGQVFGRLTVEGSTETRRRSEKVWQCRCECGNTIGVVTSDLRQDSIKSCGCLRTDYYKSISKADGESALHGLIVRIRKQAKYRNLTFSLTDEECRSLFKQNCYYCGSIPEQERKTQQTKTGSFIYNGLDRQDNNKGYEIGNVVSCCGICNRLKGKQSAKEFAEWIERVCHNQEFKKVG